MHKVGRSLSLPLELVQRKKGTTVGSHWKNTEKQGGGGENEGECFVQVVLPWSAKDRWGQERGDSVLFCPSLGTLEPW